MRIQILQLLESFFDFVQRNAEELRTRCAVCPDCGRNRYRGAPCVGAGSVA
jgi:hypothetical protein